MFSPDICWGFFFGEALDLKDTPYGKVADTLIVPLKLFRLLKAARVIADSYVKDDEFYAVDGSGEVHWFEYKGKLSKDVVSVLP